MMRTLGAPGCGGDNFPGASSTQSVAALSLTPVYISPNNEVIRV
jgi:hypothetical protein